MKFCKFPQLLGLEQKHACACGTWFVTLVDKKAVISMQMGIITLWNQLDDKNSFGCGCVKTPLIVKTFWLARPTSLFEKRHKFRLFPEVLRMHCEFERDIRINRLGEARIVEKQTKSRNLEWISAAGKWSGFMPFPHFFYSQKTYFCFFKVGAFADRRVVDYWDFGKWQTRFLLGT